MPTASDLLLNLSIQIEGEQGLETLAEELKALEAEQFKYNKQAQQTTTITQKVESATRSNTSSFKESISTLKEYETAARNNVSELQRLLQSQNLSKKERKELNDKLKVAQGELNNVNRAQGMLSDQIRMAQTTVAKYGEETQTNSDRQRVLSDNLTDLSSRLDAVKARARDLQTQMRSGGEMSQVQADEFRKVSDRAKELERDAEELTNAFGNNRKEVNAYRKVLVDTRAVQSRLSDAVAKNNGSFAQLSNRIADVNRSVNSMKNKFFESDLRAKELESSTMTLAQANQEVEKQNIRMSEAMQSHRKVLRGMREDLQALVDTNQITRNEFEKLDKQLNSATANAGTSQRAIQNLSNAFGSSAQVQNRATQALISFSQGLQDSPQFMMSAGAGFRAISNNLTQTQQMYSLLTESVKEANGGTASFGMTIKALGKALMGPAGIMIAFTAVTTAIAFYTQGLDKSKRKTKELSERTDSFVDKLSSLKKPLFTDAFGTNELIFQSAEIKSFLSDIESTQQRIATAKFERLNPFAFLFSGQTHMFAARAARQADIIGEAYKDAFDIQKVTDIPIFATTRKLAEPLRGLFSDQIQEMKSAQGQLERFANQYGLTAKEVEKLEEQLRDANEEVQLNNFLLENSPLAQFLEGMKRRLRVFQLEAEQGKLRVEEARNERAALEKSNKSRAESILELDKFINTQIISNERKKQAINRLGELNASYDATAAVIDFLTSFIDENTESTKANTKANEDAIDAQYRFREIGQRAQREIDLLAAEDILNARARAKKVLEIRQRAAIDEAESMRDMRLLMAQARREYDNTIEQIDEQEARRAEEKRDRISRANHELNMIRIRQTKDGTEELEALHKAERMFLFQQLHDELIHYEEYELKKTQLAEKYANMRKNNQKDEDQAVFNSLQMGLQQVSQVFGALNQLSNTRAQVSEEAARREFEVQKKLSYASAVVNAAAAAVSVLAQEKGGAVAKIIGMTSVLAAAAIQIATIRKQQFGYGGGGESSSQASFGTTTTPVESSPPMQQPNYTPSAEGEMRGRQTVVEIHADRKKLYSMVKQGEEEYRQRQV